MLFAGGFEGRSAAAFSCAFALVAAGLTVFSLSGEVKRLSDGSNSNGSYRPLQEHGAGPAGTGLPAAGQRGLRLSDIDSPNTRTRLGSLTFAAVVVLLWLECTWLTVFSLSGEVKRLRDGNTGNGSYRHLLEVTSNASRLPAAGQSSLRMIDIDSPKQGPEPIA